MILDISKWSLENLGFEITLPNSELKDELGVSYFFIAGNSVKASEIVNNILNKNGVDAFVVTTTGISNRPTLNMRASWLSNVWIKVHQKYLENSDEALKEALLKVAPKICDVLIGKKINAEENASVNLTSQRLAREIMESFSKNTAPSQINKRDVDWKEVAKRILGKGTFADDYNKEKPRGR